MIERARKFFTPRELADIASERGLRGFSERSIRRLASREGWDGLPDSLARPRSGREGGGGTEYHVSLLPEALQSVLDGVQRQARLQAAHSLQDEADRRRSMAVNATALSARSRSVMEARAEILTSIEGFATSRGEKRAWGIARFLDAQEDWRTRQDIEARRDAGAILTEREAASLANPLELTAADGFHLSASRVQEANDRPRATPLSERSLWRWFKARDARGVLALAPVPPKEADPIPPAFGAFVKFYALPSKPTAAAAHKKYMEAAARIEGVQPMTLSLSQVRHILRNRLNNIEKNVGREGLLTLRSRMAYVTRKTDDMLPTTVYTADGKTFDAEVADPVSRRPMRPEITSVLDVATRKCVGTAVARKENVIAVTEALRRSCSVHGIPAIFYTDRGPGYKNKTFDAEVGGLMGRLSITKMHALPYNSQAKGLIERFNAVWNDLAKELPTYIGTDMDKEAGGAIHKETRGEIKEFGIARRLPSWEDFLAMIDRTVAAYNDRPHQGLPRFEDPQTGRLRHMTPNEAWDAHVRNGFEPVPVDTEEEDDLFRPYEIRTCRRALVRLNTNSYFHEALGPYHERKVMVGYDNHQADKVWVREFDVETGQPGRLICVALFEGNATQYVPYTVAQKAMDERTKGRLARVGRKVEDIEAERDDTWLIEGSAQDPAPFLAEPEPVALAIDNTSDEQVPPKTRRRVFATDEDLALWALENPGKVTRNQIDVLRECLASSTARELFRMSGIDLEALRTLLRAAA